MTRPVSEVVADLRNPLLATSLHAEAAALLERLDAAFQRTVEDYTHVLAARAVAEATLETIHDLLPTCPTCEGSARLTGNDTGNVYTCPDCTDGHVPLARLVALWEAVHHLPPADALRSSGRLLDYLRSVKP